MSIVSASRRAGSPQTGQVVLRNSSWVASGDWPDWSIVTSSGATTGSWSSGTATMPWVSQ